MPTYEELRRRRAQLLRQLKEADARLAPTVTKLCPHCEKRKNAETGFYQVTDKVTGLTKPQSWCKACQSSKEAHPTRFGLKRKTNDRRSDGK